MVDSKDKSQISNDFDIGSELSALVEKNVISSQIAKKLEQKLKEKNVELTKEQLEQLVNKIKDIIRNYSKYDKTNKPTNISPKTEPQQISDNNMQKIIDTIEKLEKRIDHIETRKQPYQGNLSKKPSKMVRTDDINVPGEETITNTGWELDPLTDIPNDPESIIVLMKWLQYLIDKCGHSNLSKIIDYYVDISWISQEVKITLLDYSQGIKEETKQSQSNKTINDLTSRDHIQSLIYIQKLRGREFDRHFIDRIDNELYRMTKKLYNHSYK